MLAFLRRRSAGLIDDRALAWYGALLAAAQLVTTAWMVQHRIWELLARGSEALCWPMLPGCAGLRVFSAQTIALIVAASGLLGAGAGALFALRKRAGWWLLAVNQLVLVLLIAQDLRLRRNQHYMLCFAVAAYLLLPEPKRAVRYLIVLFYLFAGTLKLNQEWLTGSALYGPVPISGWPLRIACGYVVALELIFVFGLLSRRRWIFRATLAQVLIFELASYPIVGFFYPLLMLLLLGLFPLARAQDEAPLRFYNERRSTQLFLGFFALLQLVPHLFPGDTAITGEGRLFALHMFDAKVVCSATATVRRGAQVLGTQELNRDLAIRIACDPLVLLERGQALCARAPSPLYQVDLSLVSRRTSDREIAPHRRAARSLRAVDRLQVVAAQRLDRERALIETGHPGGQSSGRPPSRWKWRCPMLWPASSPALITTR